MNIDDTEITVELYENVMDFYIPLEALDICRRTLKVNGVEVNYVALECWIVFKARRGSGKDLAELATVKNMIEEGVLSINKKLLEKIIDFYEEDKQYIIGRLRTLKIL